jgi:hypothetical protein
MQYYPSDKLNNLTEKILELMPPLKEFFEGEDTIEPYSRKLGEYQTDEVHVERQKYFIDLIRNKISRIFNEEEKKKIKVLSNSERGLKGGVVDHHGIINDPMLFGLNIVTDYHRMFDRETNGDILTFATGNVPVNDYFHKRGFTIEGKRVNLFIKEEKNKFVFGLPVKQFNIVDTLKKNHTWHLYTNESQRFLTEITDLIRSIDLTGCERLGDQITKINYYLWPMIFEKQIRTKVSNLISLEYDDLVIDYLVHVLETDKNSFIYKILFDEATRSKALGYFEGKTGAWDRIKNKGTHFFWFYNDAGDQLRLNLMGESLESSEGGFKANWNPDEIIRLLRLRKLLPCMLIKFALIIFYMGLRPLTGYGSTNYISVMKQDLYDFLGDEFSTEKAKIEKIKVNNLTTVPVVLKKTELGIESYYAFDAMKDGGLSLDYLKKLNSVPLKNFLASRLNDVYDYAFSLYGSGPKSEITITPKDIEPLLKEIFI